MSKKKKSIHTCECGICQKHPYRKIAKEHRAINRVLAGLDERNKRRFAGLLASHQGNKSLLSEITGLSPNTIGRGQLEVEYPSQIPIFRVRHASGGRIPVEKNHLEF